MFGNQQIQRKAPNWVPFVFVLGIFIFSLQVFASECSTPNLPEKIIEVSKVYDGDTIKLEDGRKLRLIGINTPERGRDGAANQPFYDEAKSFLQKTLAAQQYKIKIISGKDKRDRYKRQLAHIFTPEGKNINAALIKNGLAFHITVPPNFQFQNCYKKAELTAQKTKKAIWSHRFSQALPAHSISDKQRGFQLVTGTVQRVGESRSSFWLNLDKHFALRVMKKDIVHFKSFHPKSLLKQRITVRGWIYKRKNEFRMALRHPASITVHSTD